MEKVDEILAEAVGKANAAEDAVEKAVTISEMIAVGGDDLGEVLWTIATEPCSSWESIGLGMLEQAVQEAQTATCEARNFLNATQAAAKGYKSKKVKAKAIQELGQLQQQVQKAQQKLVPLKNVWQEFVQRTAAHKMMQEVLQKLSPAEARFVFLCPQYLSILCVSNHHLASPSSISKIQKRFYVCLAFF